MNCYNHQTQPAVAQCPNCGKGLCGKCASLYSMPICNTCNKRRIFGERSRIITEMLLTFGLGLLLTVLFLYFEHGQHPNNPIKLYVVLGVMFFYIFSGIIPGWKTLTSITPRVFLFLPLIGWLLYFIVKFLLSVAVGLVMLPVRTVWNIARLVSLQNV